jgi:epoxyqueuosine reductase
MKEKDKMSNVNRRDFFKIGGLSAVAGVSAIAALPKKAAAKKLDEHITNDLVKIHDDFPAEI